VHIRSFFYNEPRALRELRVLSVGGDQLEQELAARLVELRKGQEVYLTYGLTQAGPRVSTLAAHAASSSQLSSVGLPHEGTEVWLQPVLDRSGRQQLFVKSDTVMKRTIGRVEGRSNELVAARTIATGDAFEIDEDGYLFFKGRLSDFISRKGEKISLATVRRLASGLPHVAVAQTNAFRHRDGGEDYDLELRVDAAWLTEERRAGLQAILKQILRRAEMPHTITIEPASPLDAQRYK
ncbi:MAG TPA: class I adenylate-forming enzyme family protein, partial [Terracidiphilus sp.]